VTAALVVWLGRRLLHARTCELVLEPALADVAHDELTGARGRTAVDRWRLGLATLAALVRGLWHDLVWEERRPSWHPPMATIVTTALLVASYNLSMGTLMLGVGSRWSPVRALALDTVPQQRFALGMTRVFAFGVAWVVRHCHDARSR
jgi:hypothetical protein